MKCPYCKQLMDIDHDGVWGLSAKRRKVFEYVAASGPKGVPFQELSDHMKFKNKITVRTTIFQINRVIHPARIECHGGMCRLTR